MRLEQQKPSWPFSRMLIHGKTRGSSRERTADSADPPGKLLVFYPSSENYGWQVSGKPAANLGKTLLGYRRLMETFVTCLPRITSAPCLHLGVSCFWEHTALPQGCNAMPPMLSLILFSVLVVKLMERKVSRWAPAWGTRGVLRGGFGRTWCLHPEPSPGDAVQAPVPALALRAAPASDGVSEEQQHPAIRCPQPPCGCCASCFICAISQPSHGGMLKTLLASAASCQAGFRSLRKGFSPAARSFPSPRGAVASCPASELSARQEPSRRCHDSGSR